MATLVLTKGKIRAFGLLGLAVLGASVSAAPSPPWPHEGSDLPPDPAVVWGRLENGLRYAILPNAEPPKRVSLRLLVEVGSLVEEDADAGLAHYFEHLAFNGSENFPPGELIKFLERLGLGFGADTNAHTSFNETVYKLDLPHVEPDLVATGLRVFADYAYRLLLLPEEVEKERGVILAEMRDRDTPGFRELVDAYRFVLPYSLIPRRFPIGLEETVKTVGPEDFREYYRQWYTPDRMAVIVVGDVDPHAMEAAIKAAFAAMPPADTQLPEPNLGEVLPRGRSFSTYFDGELPATEVSIAAAQPATDIQDNQARRFRDLKNEAANAILNRRLELLARQEGSPFSEAMAFSYEMFDFAEISGIYASAGTAETWQESLDVIQRELRRALAYGFTPSELQIFVAQKQNALRTAVDQRETRSSVALADGLADSLSEAYVFTAPEQDREMTEAMLAELTAEEVLAEFRRSWGDETRLVRLAANQPVEGAYQKLVERYRQGEQAPVEPPEEEKLPDFGYTDFGPVGQVISREPIPGLDAEKVVFANQVVLAVKRTDYERNRVRVAASFGSGELTLPEDLVGLGFFGNATYIEGGLGKLSADQVRKIMAGRNVSAAFAVAPDSFVLSGTTTPTDLLTQLQLLAAYVVDPGFRPEAERQFRLNLPRIYQEVNHTVDGVMGDRVEAFLAGDDFRFGVPDEAVARARTLDELRAWTQQARAEAKLELAIVGDVEPDAVVAAVAQTFGALPERASSKPDLATARQLKLPAAPDDQVFPFETEIPRARVIANWHSVDRDNIALDRRLSFLARAMSLRLNDRVREELGAAYSPYAWQSGSDVFDDYGYLRALVDVDPSQAREVAELLKEIASDIAANGITEDEYVRVRAPQLAGLEQQFRDNEYWVGRVLLGVDSKAYQLDWARTLFTDWPSITREEVNALAKQYLVPERLILTTIYPQPLSQTGSAPAEEPVEAPAAVP